MKKKTRLIILLLCVISFLIMSPILVGYSMGYRFDIKKKKIVATGGIYIRTFPAADQIIFDYEKTLKPGFLQNYVFVQSLLPNNHNISIKKAGYYDYEKILPVEENEVTKLENVILFKKDLSFQQLKNQSASPFLVEKLPEKYIIKNNNLYYSESLENKNLSATIKKTPLITNIVSFTLSENNIVWLGLDGLLYKTPISSFLEKQPTEDKIPLIKTKENNTHPAIKINKKGSYKIILIDQDIFIDNNGEFLFLNNKENTFTSLLLKFKDAKISPDRKNLVFFNNNEIYLFPLSNKDQYEKFLLYKSNEIIKDVFWLNNDYIIFSAGNNIMISEIDYRGNINIITLFNSFKNPELIYNNSENKLYILSEKITYVSEKIIP